ncbi:MAG: hypothetical protein ABWY20_07910 [Mycobacterium sp.]
MYATTKIELPGVRGEDGEYKVEPRSLQAGEEVSKKDLLKHQSEEDIKALISDGALSEEPPTEEEEA